jgi:hypothetical protein
MSGLNLSDGKLSVRILGHISPGSDRAAEEDLTRRQVERARSICQAKGMRSDRITSETSPDPDENGAYNVVTCKVVKVDE